MNLDFSASDSYSILYLLVWSSLWVDLIKLTSPSNPFFCIIVRSKLALIFWACLLRLSLSWEYACFNYKSSFSSSWMFSLSFIFSSMDLEYFLEEFPDLTPIDTLLFLADVCEFPDPKVPLIFEDWERMDFFEALRHLEFWLFLEF